MPKKSSITLEFHLRCRPTDVFEALTSERFIRAYTQSEASVDATEGGSFSMFGGSLTGQFESLVPGESIVQTWRFNNWKDDDVSRVHITLTAQSHGHTVVTLKHTDIPEVDKYGNDDIAKFVYRGWVERIFRSIANVCGFGLLKAPKILDGPAALEANNYS
ncbi:MAG: hypothetical protein MHM6MM_004137 [Cercozoa sp. M6MM]